jgi:hypothetical protein
MDMRLIGVALVFAALAMASQGARAAPAEVVDLAAIAPQCHSPFKIKKDLSACEEDQNEFVKLKASVKVKADCEKVVGAMWSNDACVLNTDVSSYPKPDCGSKLPDLAYNADKKSCQVVRDTPRSSLGDYVGDCFKIHSPPPQAADGVDDGLRAGMHFFVESQTKLGKDDKELVVSPAEPVRLGNWTLWCSSTGERERRMTASTLINSGAHRYGWSYGVLTVPFKYYRSSHSFGSGALNVGPFLGRRWGSSGSSVTAALAATLGSVKGEERDANNAITATPDLTAFSFALGLMLDVSKNPDLKPFKVGIFWGSDRVNGGDKVKFPNNKKHWLAFQIGYDFTDTK